MNKQCFCVGKVRGCECDARCRCECSCIPELAKDISEHGKFEYTENEAEVLLGRLQDAKEGKNMLSLDEFIERCKDMGIEPTDEDRVAAKETIRKLKEKCGL